MQVPRGYQYVIARHWPGKHQCYSVVSGVSAEYIALQPRPYTTYKGDNTMAME